MVRFICTVCDAEATSFDVASGNIVCSNCITPNAFYFEIRPLKGGGFGVYRVKGKTTAFEIDFIHKNNAVIYGYGRMLEERSHSPHLEKATP